MKPIIHRAMTWFAAECWWCVAVRILMCDKRRLRRQRWIIAILITFHTPLALTWHRGRLRGRCAKNIPPTNQKFVAGSGSDSTCPTKCLKGIQIQRKTMSQILKFEVCVVLLAEWAVGCEAAAREPATREASGG